MPRSVARAYSRYSKNALALLGGLIREGRIERGMTAQELAERTGMSRSMLQRIEKGDPKCEIGAVFEAATIVGVTLFAADDRADLETHLRRNREKLALLPKSVRRSERPVYDDF